MFVILVSFGRIFLAELITSLAHLLGLPVPYAANEHCIAGGHPRLAQHVYVHRVALHMLKGALPPNQGALQPPLWLWPVLQQEKAALQGERTGLLLWVPCTGAPASQQPHGQSSSTQKEPVGLDLDGMLTFGFSSLITRTVVPLGENMSRLWSRSAMLSCHQATTTSFGRCLIGSGL